jgi:hypothetical protein
MGFTWSDSSVFSPSNVLEAGVACRLGRSWRVAVTVTRSVHTRKDGFAASRIGGLDYERHAGSLEVETLYLLPTSKRAGPFVGVIAGCHRFDDRGPGAEFALGDGIDRGAGTGLGLGAVWGVQIAASPGLRVDVRGAFRRVAVSELGGAASPAGEDPSGHTGLLDVTIRAAFSPRMPG